VCVAAHTSGSLRALFTLHTVEHRQTSQRKLLHSHSMVACTEPWYSQDVAVCVFGKTTGVNRMYSTNMTFKFPELLKTCVITVRLPELKTFRLLV